MRTAKKSLALITGLLISGMGIVLCSSLSWEYAGQHNLNEEYNKDFIVGKPLELDNKKDAVKSKKVASRRKKSESVELHRDRNYYGPKMMIAVMDFSAKDVSQPIASNVSELIRTDLINTGRYIVIERSQMKEILKEQGFQQTGCTDTACAVQVGKLLSARKILIGSVMKLGSKLIISGRIVDVEKGVGEQGAKGKANSVDDLDDGITEFINNLSGL